MHNHSYSAFDAPVTSSCSQVPSMPESQPEEPDALLSSLGHRRKQYRNRNRNRDAGSSDDVGDEVDWESAHSLEGASSRHAKRHRR
jgi:hypothetical protein